VVVVVVVVVIVVVVAAVAVVVVAVDSGSLHRAPGKQAASGEPSLAVDTTTTQ